MERLSEPLHLNLIAMAVALLGSTRAKILFDLHIRQQHAFCLLDAADRAQGYGYRKVTVAEFGVANGAGLLNICELAEKITRATGIEFRIVGFDSGAGMPELRDYRDHPEAYQPGWYPMDQPDQLRKKLPPNAELIIGDISQTVPKFLESMAPDAPIGFVSIDVDYYWSTMEVLKAFQGSPELYLPIVTLYLDDVSRDIHNKWCGELGAVEDFNAANGLRKIAPLNFLRENRVFKNARWIGQIYGLHVLDHPRRFTALQNYGRVVIDNPYMKAN